MQEKLENAFFSAAKPQAPASFRFQYFSTHRSWRKKKKEEKKDQRSDVIG